MASGESPVSWHGFALRSDLRQVVTEECANSKTPLRLSGTQIRAAYDDEKSFKEGVATEPPPYAAKSDFDFTARVSLSCTLSLLGFAVVAQQYGFPVVGLALAVGGAVAFLFGVVRGAQLWLRASRERPYRLKVKHLSDRHVDVLLAMYRRVDAYINAGGDEMALDKYWDAVDLVEQRESLSKQYPGEAIGEVKAAVDLLDEQILEILELFPSAIPEVASSNEKPSETEPATPETATPDPVPARILSEQVTAEYEARRTLRE